jgi:SAM-dependent methyltransferase
VRGCSVLDLACGEGFYSRLIRQAGAAQVTAVDISAEMIALAQTAEDHDPLNIHYLCADVARLEGLARYDLVSAAYLLHYADDETELQSMCDNIAACLEPGGRFVALNENPDQPEADYAAYTQYGFNKKYALPRANGSRIDYSMIAGRQVIRFDARYYTRDTYEAALARAGFRDVRWKALELSPAGVAERGEEYWRAYLNNPPIIGLEARL